MKKVAFVLPGMSGGGAERVAALLANEFKKNQIDVRYLLTHAKRDEVIRCDLSNDVPLVLFTEQIKPKSAAYKTKSKLLQIVSSLLCKPFELFKRPVPARFAKLSIFSQYSREIKHLSGLLKAEPDLTIIAFLQPTIPITLLAARGLPNRIIISERADPNRLMKKRYGKKFIEKYYTRADAAVFQTEDAKNTYPISVSNKGVVLPNPLKPGLPKPYHGARRKYITTFCRISKQKNLPVLIEAFAMIHKTHIEYKLRIIGDALNDEGVEVMSTLKKMITEHAINDAIIFEPFMTNIHEAIIHDAMYINSSDYEGISNAMLESMAIGMPVICTDCPIGGAKDTITDGENGLLVPIQDAEALYYAMKRIIEDKMLAKKMSNQAAELRKRLSLPVIAEKWMKLL